MPFILFHWMNPAMIEYRYEKIHGPGNGAKTSPSQCRFVAKVTVTDSRHQQVIHASEIKWREAHSEGITDQEREHVYPDEVVHPSVAEVK
jgi:hypothetical protein